MFIATDLMNPPAQTIGLVYRQSWTMEMQRCYFIGWASEQAREEAQPLRVFHSEAPHVGGCAPIQNFARRRDGS
jgi:hypothetical protein